MGSGAVEPVSVLVVDDDAAFRGVVRAVLADVDSVAVVGEAADGNTAILLAEELVPDVVLMDVCMPGEGGTEATRRLGDLPTSVLMLTASDDEDDLFESLRAGADGYLLKDTPVDELVEAIEAASRGESRLSPSMASKLIGEFKLMPQAQRIPLATPQLTRREFEVLQLVAVGKPNREIAEDLCLSGHTVKRHVANILSKLHQRSRLDAVMAAMRMDLLNPGTA